MCSGKLRLVSRMPPSKHKFIQFSLILHVSVPHGKGCVSGEDTLSQIMMILFFHWNICYMGLMLLTKD